MAEGKCETCHKRHGFDQKLVLVAGPPDLCITCHAEQGASGAQRSGHPVPERGDCLVCHAAHNSDKDGLIRRYNVDLACLACHEDVKAKIASGGHPPAQKDDCGDCHQVHGNERPMLLKSDTEALCLDCHGKTREAIAGRTAGRVGRALRARRVTIRTAAR
ncbi:MAG: hypothetical protein IPK72_03315 [Candidatus Eisenbacteria bacterium]|nr:hypothetical protein [Candidatus Eisenbacteria bacterium]